MCLVEFFVGLMDKFVIKRPRNSLDSSGVSSPAPTPNVVVNSNSRSKFDPNDIVSDPGLRKLIEEYLMMVLETVFGESAFLKVLERLKIE